MPKIRVQVPSIFRKYWNMYPKACIDDNLYRWTGKGFHKQKIDAKADHTGIVSWEVVDEKHYIYNAVFTYDVDQVDLKNETFGELILKKLLQHILDYPYTFLIDAGHLGSFSNAQTLNSKGFKFVINCRDDRPTFLWSTLHKGLEKYYAKCLYSKKYSAISYYIKGSGSSKTILNFITNLREMDNPVSVPIYEASKKKAISREAPQVLKFYRKNHGFVDQRKGIEANVRRNKSKMVHGWRTELQTWIYMLLTNAYVYYSHVKNKPKRYSFRDFVTKLVIQLGLRFGVNTIQKRQYTPPVTNNPPNTLLVHSMTPSHIESKCMICQKRTKMVYN